MNKFLLPLIFILFLNPPECIAQPGTAYDFKMNDCKGQMHHLFSELDSGYTVIIEFFMLSCSPCIDAGDALEPMFMNLKSTCSDKIKFYHFGYTNSYTCSQIVNWVTTNGYTSVPFDSGAVQVAYYGGMGMPTIAVVAGNTHKVLISQMGFSPGDTAMVADSIRNFLGCATTGIQKNNDERFSNIEIFPTPSNGEFSVTGLPGNANLSVYSILGEKIYQVEGRYGKTSVSLPKGLEQGIYILYGEINGQVFSRKIILQ